MLIAATTPAHAASVGEAARIDALERQLAEQNSRIAQLEALLQTAVATNLAPPRPAAPAPLALPSPQAQTPHAQTSVERLAPVARAPQSLGQAQALRVPGLDVSGDLRLRQEFNGSDPDAPDRSRSVLRARLGATYAISKAMTIGAQLSTGDPDDPNTTDVTLSNFADDFAVSLDQVYARFNLGGLTLYGGKFPQIVRRTDLVWDGDVNPQGLGFVYEAKLSDTAALSARGLYFIIDEAAGGSDSSMAGGQLELKTTPARDWRLNLAASYYDYRLSSLAGADGGDFRSNLLRPDGRYVSDFNLIEAIPTLTYTGLGERWPVVLTGDYVRNLGARDSQDSAWSIDLQAGRASKPGDLRLSYSFAVAEIDAVFAAFSNDNLPLATNYRLHGLSLDYVLATNGMLNATLYRYRPEDARRLPAGQSMDWRNRLRLNLLLAF